MGKKIALSVLLLLMINICFAQQPTAKQMKDSTIWRSDYKLMKEDFKAKPRQNVPVYSSISINIYSKDVSGSLLFVVEAVFLKSLSFMKTYSEYSLKHEQIIFDICELHARKLRKKISEKDFSKTKDLRKELTELYNKEIQEFIKDVEKFQKETEGGLNSVKQQMWSEKVIQEISELEDFASTELTLTAG